MKKDCSLKDFDLYTAEFKTWKLTLPLGALRSMLAC